jgi:hypothetical protein
MTKTSHIGRRTQRLPPADPDSWRCVANIPAVAKLTCFAVITGIRRKGTGLERVVVGLAPVVGPGRTPVGVLGVLHRGLVSLDDQAICGDSCAKRADMWSAKDHLQGKVDMRRGAVSLLLMVICLPFSREPTFQMTSELSGSGQSHS